LALTHTGKGGDRRKKQGIQTVKKNPNVVPAKKNREGEKETKSWPLRRADSQGPEKKTARQGGEKTGSEKVGGVA